MTQPSDPHDKLFRALLDDPERARALLVDHLPAGVVAELAETLPVPEDVESGAEVVTPLREGG